MRFGWKAMKGSAEGASKRMLYTALPMDVANTGPCHAIQLRVMDQELLVPVRVRQKCHSRPCSRVMTCCEHAHLLDCSRLCLRLLCSHGHTDLLLFHLKSRQCQGAWVSCRYVSRAHSGCSHTQACLCEQGIVQTLDEVGVLHISSQELGVFHTESGQVCSRCRLELCLFVVGVETLPSLLSTVPVLISASADLLSGHTSIASKQSSSDL